ncbi:MAG: UDP-2,4-diacetamido-2,4,6-trideoxy-beta-L-altropyranose hydrolase [Nitrospinota bacterium]|jgi:UDP-2,4-diacetamido-2,4,6-trideoxy-beta-L-altropyranose hydrolase|nr:UDP-2,4-diacetamido-2,4,6-trideoxy-beta-L-altropyranose hydrolase [Nitrospinota bacterium]MDP7663038.1 UDP-2,4-diacetamido-2,4,6-trideoxy-beta-L-altropyranose hydrolase [Nitrospinota bacterium]
MSNPAFKRTAIFRTEASPEIGGGHLIRCLSLADGLSKEGWKCVFAATGKTPDTVPALSDSGHTIQILSGPAEDEPADIASKWGDGYVFLVVDHYGRDINFEGACRSWADGILVIDDLANRAHDCDLLLDQTLGRVREDYAPSVNRECRMLLGPDYALLRDQFPAARKEALSRRMKAGAVRRILISLGATDLEDVNSLILQGVARSGADAEVDVVMGSQSPNLAKVKKIAEGMPRKVRVLTDVSDMAALMASADLSVGAAGVSTWERCCLGLPSIVIIRAESQRLQGHFVKKNGLGMVLGWTHEVSEVDISSAVTLLVENSDRRQEIGNAASAACDGRGVKRTVREIDKLARPKSLSVG